MHNEYNDIESLPGGVSEPDAHYATGRMTMPFATYDKVFSTQISSINKFSELQDIFKSSIGQYTAISDSLKGYDEILGATKAYTAAYTKVSDSLKFLDSLGKISQAINQGISAGTKSTVRRNSVKSDQPAKSVKPRIQSTYVNDKSTSDAQIPSIASSAVTDSADINRINREYRNSLDKITSDFLVMLKREDFEDGMENDSIKTMRGFLNQNEAVTYLWMHSLFTRNEDDPRIVSGLLRIISMTVKHEDIDSLMPIVLAALRSGNSYEQEAAVMVIEEWRTAKCRDVLRDSLDKNHFQTDILRDYAETVYSELREEM